MHDGDQGRYPPPVPGVPPASSRIASAHHGGTEPPWPAPESGSGAPGAAQPGGDAGSRGALIGGVLAAVAAVAAIVVAVTGFWAPGYFTYTVLDTESVENGITAHLRTGGRTVEVGSVSCPGEIRVRVGDTFACTFQLGGAPHTVTATILDQDGTYRVDAPAAH